MKPRTAQRLPRGIIAVLLAVIAAMAYKFIVAGSVEPAADARSAILLEPGERAFVLAETRGFVAGLRQLAQALSEDDMKAVASAARRMGMAAAHSAPAPMIGKLPLEFKTLGFEVHREFDIPALDAESLADARRVPRNLPARRTSASPATRAARSRRAPRRSRPRRALSAPTRCRAGPRRDGGARAASPRPGPAARRAGSRARLHGALGVSVPLRARRHPAIVRAGWSRAPRS